MMKTLTTITTSMTTSNKSMPEDVDKKNRYYCSQKFNQVSIDIDRLELYSCCAATPQKIDIKWLEHNSGKLFNTNLLQEERSMMLNNIPVDSCANACWKNEENGIASRRQITQSTEVTHKNINATPKHITIIVSNHCNLTCVYCCKQYSSAWYQDIAQNGEYQIECNDRFSINNKDKILNLISQKELSNSKNKKFLLDEIGLLLESPTLKDADIVGGEPFLYLYLEDIIKVVPAHVNLRIFTGLGVNEKRLSKELDKLLKYKNVTLAISGENVRRSFEFTRYGVTWDQFNNNIQQIKSRNIDSEFKPVLSNLTIFGIWDFINYAKDTNIPIRSYSNCTDPDFLSINVIDKVSKEDILHKVHLLPEKAQNIIINSINVEPTALQCLNLKKYLKEFSQRRNLSMDIFPKSFIEWLENVV